MRFAAWFFQALDWLLDTPLPPADRTYRPQELQERNEALTGDTVGQDAMEPEPRRFYRDDETARRARAALGL